MTVLFYSRMGVGLLLSLVSLLLPPSVSHENFSLRGFYRFSLNILLFGLLINMSITWSFETPETSVGFFCFAYGALFCGVWRNKECDWNSEPIINECEEMEYVMWHHWLLSAPRRLRLVVIVKKLACRRKATITGAKRPGKPLAWAYKG